MQAMGVDPYLICFLRFEIDKHRAGLPTGLRLVEEVHESFMRGRVDLMLVAQDLPEMIANSHAGPTHIYVNNIGHQSAIIKET
jgi:hypothetical protein